MPYRKTPLKNKEIYHVFNRSVDRQPIFTDKRGCNRAITTIDYYRYSDPHWKLSYFISRGSEERQKLYAELKSSKKNIEILSYCFKPNHYHLLVQQCNDGGISEFIGRFQNSFAKHFNTSHERKGPLFEGPFKVVQIETERQLLYVSRYIHLNPFTATIIRNIDDVKSYRWSSMPEYCNLERASVADRVGKDLILSHFTNESAYQKFVLDYASHQKSLAQNRHLYLEE